MSDTAATVSTASRAAPAAGPGDAPAPAERPVVVEAVGLSKVFRDFWHRPKAVGVNGTDFVLRQGDTIGFLGPNGSGKSTTIKMILGLLYPTGGSLKVFGRAPTDVASKARIGYLPEETYLYKYLTAAETLDFFGALFNLPAPVRRERARELLAMVGLAREANRPVGEFSKGMARRVGLAQALINDPDLVILDEPTSGLDPLGTQQVKDIIRLLTSRGKTIILCSHLLADVQDVCDQVLIMYGGRIRARGKLSELLAVEDRTRIVTPALTSEQVARVMQMLNEMVGSADVAVDNPRLDLEDFFMQVVRAARAESAATSGAREEGRIASYLTGAPPSPEAMLQALTGPEAEPAPVAPAAPPPPPDLARLEELAAAETPETPAAPAEPPAPVPMTDAERAAKSRELADLLRRRDHEGDER